VRGASAVSSLVAIFGLGPGRGLEQDRQRYPDALLVSDKLLAAGELVSVASAMRLFRDDTAFRATLSRGQRFGFANHADLTAPLGAGDVEAMAAALRSHLGGIEHGWPPSHEAWTVERVGGARRRLEHGTVCGHDADFVVTHPHFCSYSRTADVLRLLVSALRASGLIVSVENDGVEPEDGGWSMVQTGQTWDESLNDLDSDLGSARSKNAPQHLCELPHVRMLKRRIASSGSGWQHWDKLDRFFGVWRGTDGKLRRIDLVVAAWIEYPFALLSWTGSALFNRLVRQRANDHGLSLSAHCLLTVPEDGSEPKLLPYEDASPARVTSERGIFKLLGLPWLPPHLRDA